MKMFCAAVVGLLLPATVLALGMETFGNSPMVNQPEWAAGVVDVANLPSRMYSRWVNGNESLYYRGDAQALIEALRTYAAVKDDVREVILIPGSGKTTTFDRRPMDFDWQLHVPSGIYRAVAGKKHAVLTVYVNHTRPRPLEKKLVDKWLVELGSDAFATRDKARQELEKLGRDAKPYLREALKAEQDLETRRRIESLLKGLPGIDVTDLEIPPGLTVVTVDELLNAGLRNLNGADSTRSALAAQELSSLASFSDRVIPALIGMLQKDKNEYVRRVAAGCLASLGAKSAVPVLKDVEGADVNVQRAFRDAIERIDKFEEKAGPDAKQQSILKEIRELKKTR